MNSRDLLKKLKENNLGVFTAKDLEVLLQKKPYNVLKTLKKQKEIFPIKKGVYSLQNVDDRVVATRIIEPSYISFLSALNYYNLTDQMPVKIQLITTKRKKHKNFDFTTIKKDLFFGYTNVKGIVIAEKEKAVIDCLYLPKKARGSSAIKDIIINNIGELDIRKLKKYASKDKLIKKRLQEVLDDN